MEQNLAVNSGILAYDSVERVAAYDADMDLMHPNRRKMVQVILAVLAASMPDLGLVIDLGTGTGFLLEQLLYRFPNCCAVAIDGSRQMLDAAKSRLGPLASRTNFRLGDFRELDTLCPEINSADAVVSSYALHHLTIKDKSSVVDQSRNLLRENGWLLNADVIVAENEFLESMVQRMRVRDIVDRNRGRDPRFCDEVQTRGFLDELERNEGDQPQKLTDDLGILYEHGYRNVALLWKDTREVVYAGVR